jgi:hypothetical protein
MLIAGSFADLEMILPAPPKQRLSRLQMVILMAVMVVMAVLIRSV